VITLINQFLPKVSAMVLIIMMLLLVLGIFGASAEGWTGWPFFLAVLVSVIGVGWSVFSSIPGLTTTLPSWLRFSSTDKGILLLVGIMLIIVMMFKDDKPEQNWGKWVKDELGPSQFGRPGGK